jgi:hypothetical protein
MRRSFDTLRRLCKFLTVPVITLIRRYGVLPHTAGFTEVDMHSAGDGHQFDNITIPAGDPGEQLVANLILSLIMCELYSQPTAITYITRAHELALRLESRTITYRPTPPSKFARMKFEVEGESETLLFSLIDNTLVMPQVGPAELSKFALTAGAAINLTNLDVAHFVLRLRTRRLVAALEPLKSIESPEELTDATHGILAKCFYREIISEDPLVRADDCIILSRAFIGKRNIQMAGVALKNAHSEVEMYMRSTPLGEHPPSVQKMKEQIAVMIKELGTGAA